VVNSGPGFNLDKTTGHRRPNWVGRHGHTSRPIVRSQTNLLFEKFLSLRRHRGGKGNRRGKRGAANVRSEPITTSYTKSIQKPYGDSREENSRRARSADLGGGNRGQGDSENGGPPPQRQEGRGFGKTS